MARAEKLPWIEAYEPKGIVTGSMTINGSMLGKWWFHRLYHEDDSTVFCEMNDSNPWPGPWTVTELVSGARRGVERFNGEGPCDVESVSNVLHIIRMPLLMATKIQRAYRAWLTHSPEGKMASVCASDDPRDLVAMHERDIEHMVNVVECSRLAKIQLKKTIMKKTRRITQLTKETHDIRQRPIAEMIFNDLLQYCDDAPRGHHEEITVRFNLHGATHVADGGNDLLDEPYCERDCNEVRSVSANSGARAIRMMIEAGLDERCHRLKYGRLKYWDSGREGVSVYVCWR